jgi:hypothetical protein
LPPAAENQVGQVNRSTARASDVPVRDQPGSQFTTDHAGRAQDQDVHNTPFPQGMLSRPQLISRPL